MTGEVGDVRNVDVTSSKDNREPSDHSAKLSEDIATLTRLTTWIVVMVLILLVAIWQLVILEIRVI